MCAINLTASQPPEFACRFVSSPGERLRALVQYAILLGERRTPDVLLLR